MQERSGNLKHTGVQVFDKQKCSGYFGGGGGGADA